MVDWQMELQTFRQEFGNAASFSGVDSGISAIPRFQVATDHLHFLFLGPCITRSKLNLSFCWRWAWTTGPVQTLCTSTGWRNARRYGPSTRMCSEFNPCPGPWGVFKFQTMILTGLLGGLGKCVLSVEILARLMGQDLRLLRRMLGRRRQTRRSADSVVQSHKEDCKDMSMLGICWQTTLAAGCDIAYALELVRRASRLFLGGTVDGEEWPPASRKKLVAMRMQMRVTIVAKR